MMKRTHRHLDGLLILGAASLVLACSDDERAPDRGGAGGATTVTTSAGAGGGGAQGGSGGKGGETSGACQGYPEGAQSLMVDGATHCYWLVAGATAQIAANDDGCGDHHLATIGSAEENAHVEAVAAGAFPIWIGLRCDVVPGAGCLADLSGYEWMTGEPVTFVNWASGEPAEPRGAAMVEGGEWIGSDALQTLYPYVCESGPTGM